MTTQPKRTVAVITVKSEEQLSEYDIALAFEKAIEAMGGEVVGRECAIASSTDVPLNMVDYEMYFERTPAAPTITEESDDVKKIRAVDRLAVKLGALAEMGKNGSWKFDQAKGSLTINSITVLTGARNSFGQIIRMILTDHQDMFTDILKVGMGTHVESYFSADRKNGVVHVYGATVADIPEVGDILRGVQGIYLDALLYQINRMRWLTEGGPSAESRAQAEQIHRSRMAREHARPLGPELAGDMRPGIEDIREKMAMDSWLASCPSSQLGRRHRF